MPVFFDDLDGGPAQFTGLASGSWTTNIDLTDDANFVGTAPTMPVGATGAIVRVVNINSAQPREAGWRAYGSSTNYYQDVQDLTAGNHFDAYVGIVSDAIELYAEDSDINFYLIGYFTSEASFFSDANQHTFQPSSTGSWHTPTGWNTAWLSSGCVFAILMGNRASPDYGLNFRHPDNDGSDNRVPAYMNRNSCFLVPVDASKNIEVYSESTSTNIILIGEITSNATSLTESGDVSLGSSGSYATVDFSGLSPPANAVMAVVEIYNASEYRQAAWRPHEGISNDYTDLYYDVSYPAASIAWVLFPMLDEGGASNERCQAKIEATTCKFYVWGYIEDPSGEPGGPTIPVMIHHFKQAGGL